MRLLCPPGIQGPRPGQEGGNQSLPGSPVMRRGPSHPSPTRHSCFRPFPPQPPLGLPRMGHGYLPSAGAARLNLLQEVGGEQPHLAAGVDLDVAAGFISFLDHDLSGGLKV